MKAINNIMVLAFVIFLAACGSKQKPAESDAAAKPDEQEVTLTQAQYTASGILTGVVSLRKMSTTIKANGKLDVPPQQMVSVSVPIGGFVKTTSMLQGTHVHKGEVIATLEHMDYLQLQQDYLDIKSQYEFAKTEYARQQELAAENVNAKKTLQQANANFLSLQAKFLGLEGKLKILHIDPQKVGEGNITAIISVYAPITGFITEVNINAGQYVTPQDVLFRIVNTEHLHAELTVFEKDISKVEVGQIVRFTLPNEVKERTATVHLVGKEISQERTVRVHCHLDKEDTRLLPGMFLSAQIETNSTEVLALPSGAIVNFQGLDYVFVSKNKTTPDSLYHYEMQAIETGASDSGYTEIILPQGMSKESPVVVKGAYTLLGKMKNNEE